MLIEALQKQSGLPAANLHWLALTASHRYKTYEIPKRSGGSRTIHHPSKSLKGVQRWISKFLFRELAIHPCATAYGRGSSIRKNAEAHLHSSFTLRMDFKDFFPSFNRRGVEEFLAFSCRDGSMNLSKEDIEFVGGIVCRYDRLTIGAPSSPSLTNVMMYSFDQQVAELALRRNLTYTRYADDIFLSSGQSNNLGDIPNLISSIVKTYPYAKLQMNEGKTTFLSRRYTRRITGLILTPDDKISIGRDKKRAIKSMIHSFKTGELEPDEISKLAGYLSFVRDVENSFFVSLKTKYGDATIDALCRQNVIAVDV